MTDATSTDRSSGAGRALAGYGGVALSAAFFLVLLTCLEPVRNGDAVSVVWPWVERLDVSLSFRVDGLSLTFGLLVSGIGVLVMLYSTKYMEEYLHYERFFLYLSAFMVAMLGIVLSDNLVTLFVFWELTTITSYLLIGYSHDKEDSRRSALQALFVTGVGGLALLAGVLLLGHVAGTYNITAIRADADAVQAHPYYPAILILFLLGALSKSAQFPLHFWLPNAMAAPTPVSAYLHSATMVKAGIYLLARMHPTLGGTPGWMWTLMILGGITAVFASVVAIRQTDMKQTLAYTTLMALGTLTLFLAFDAEYAITGAVTFLIIHCFYKAALFLVAGLVDHGTGTRELDRLGGLARHMPATTLAAALAALSMAGLPPFLGFIGKEVLYKGAWEYLDFKVWVIGCALAANALMVAAALIVGFRPFWTATRDDSLTPHEGALRMWIGPVLLGALGLAFGIFPGWLAAHLVDPAVAAILGADAKPAELHLWAGVNAALILSIITVILGLALYFGHLALRRALATAETRLPSFDRGWDRFLDGLRGGAAWQTRHLQSGELKRYLVIVFATLLAAAGGTLAIRGGVAWPTELPELQPKHFVAVVLIIAGTALTTITHQRITAIAGLGAVGIGVALIFIIFGAPDVAITQLLVETLIVVLFAVAALKLPGLDRSDGFPSRKKDALFATAVGITVTLLLMSVTQGPLDRRITTFFEERAVPEAFGHNIVNVILVDFRALDTFGEITVVMIAAIAAWAILRTKRPGGET